MKRKLILLATVVAMALVPMVPAGAHDPGGLEDGQLTALKGRTYDGVVDDISPGGVPMEAMSDIRCEDGMAGIFPCHKVDLASFTPLPDLEATFLNDVWGWEDPVTGMQIAIAGSVEGTAFVDVTDGSNPVYLGTLPASFPGARNLWGDIRTYDDHAYIGSEAAAFTANGLEGAGVQIVDMTQFRGATGAVTVAEAGFIDDVTQSHNLSLNVDSGQLYVAGAFAGLEVCDVFGGAFNGSGGSIIYDLTADPANPAFAGCLDEEQYNHDLQCVTYHGPDPDHQGSEICIGSNESALRIYDASDPGDPQVLATVDYLDLPFIGGPIGLNYYTHQGWLTEDHAYFFLGDELDELSGAVDERTTYLWDMADLDDPQMLGVHSDGNSSIDHNMFVADNLLYQANYTSGLWIYDTWKVEQGRMKDRGHFDVFPADDDTAFFGAWGNYPYFGDGKVIVSSSDEGLFVLQSRVKSSANSNGRGSGAQR